MRAYGPHDPAPRTMKVQGPGKWPTLIEIPVPKPLAEQRRAINNAAYAQSQERPS